MSGPLPEDYDRAGYFKVFLTPPWYIGLGPGPHIKDIGETENHILMMTAGRYLINQVLYQRTYSSAYDNRRNSGDGIPSCTTLVLQLLRNFLSGDFSEYNSKNYQQETRWALLVLSSYAYDDEVRLAARMVLDYISAKIAVSSSDLRRLVPFRRKNSDPRNRYDHVTGAMTCGVVFLTAPRLEPPPPLFPWQKVDPNMGS